MSAYDYCAKCRLQHKPPCVLVEERDAAIKRAERAEAVLLKLEQWDMLTLTADGHGAATGDAPWARALIAECFAARTDTIKESD